VFGEVERRCIRSSPLLVLDMVCDRTSWSTCCCGFVQDFTSCLVLERDTKQYKMMDVSLSRVQSHRKRHHDDIDGFEYVMRRPGKSRSGRQVKPKVYRDGTVSLIGCMDDKLPLENPPSRRVQPNLAKTVTDSPMNSSAEDCQSPIGEATQRDILGNGSDRLASAPGGSRKKVPVNSKGSGGGIFKAAAISILRQEGRLMTTGEIARLALKRHLIKCSGKTPEATMASALYTDIKRKEGESTFVRPKEGLFGLREWDDAREKDVTRKSDKKSGNNSDSSSKMNAKKPTCKGSNGPAADGDAQPVGSTAKPCSHKGVLRDGLIDLLSAAEQVNGNPLLFIGSKRRKVIITAGDEPTSFLRSREIAAEKNAVPKIFKDAVKAENTNAENNEKQNTSVGEKGSIVSMKKEQSDNHDDICVQSPETRLHDLSNEHLGYEERKPHGDMKQSYLMEYYVNKEMFKSQLELLRYCIQNPNYATRAQGEEAIDKMESILSTIEQRMSTDDDHEEEENANNFWRHL
jgi:hypothetical protein